MTGRALYFTGPKSVDVRTKPIVDPGPNEVRVQTEETSVSPGTEMLLYRDEVPAGLPVDETIDALDETFSYPLQYGYAAVGRVTATGEAVDDEWLDRRVFAFNPHESHFVADPNTLVPTTLSRKQALLIPNVETAVNFVMDARPRIGARVVVFGQGPIGLLTTALLAEFPLAELVTVDYIESRRRLSESLGADRTLSPDAIGKQHSMDFDIAFELSGNPAALDDAVEVTGDAGRIIVGSWYGTKEVALDLGGSFHRSHIRIQSSQVSRLDPDHADRWDKDRRLDVALSWLDDNDLSELLTHEFDIDRAPEAYRLLDEKQGDVLQIVFTYE